MGRCSFFKWINTGSLNIEPCVLQDSPAPGAHDKRGGEGTKILDVDHGHPRSGRRNAWNGGPEGGFTKGPGSGEDGSILKSMQDGAGASGFKMQNANVRYWGLPFYRCVRPASGGLRFERCRFNWWISVGQPSNSGGLV